MIEAKKEGMPLTGVEIQSGRYAKGLPAALPAWCRPLPFIYETTGIETHFTNGLDPEPRARNTFAFHQPAMLAQWLNEASSTASFISGQSAAAFQSGDAGLHYGIRARKAVMGLEKVYEMRFNSIINGKTALHIY